MCFLGGKRRKKNARARTTAKTKAIFSRFAPAFGRAVGRFAAGLDAGLKPSSISKAKASATSRQKQGQRLSGGRTVYIPRIPPHRRRSRGPRSQSVRWMGAR